MKKLLFSTFLGILITTISCSSDSKKTTTQKIVVEETIAEPVAKSEVATINENVGIDKFAELIAQNDGQLLDVRTPEEWESGIIEGTTKINFFDTDFANQLSTLDKEKPVYIYCRSGNRSGKAAKQMEEMGFTTIYNLIGGITAWDAAGKEKVK